MPGQILAIPAMAGAEVLVSGSSADALYGNSKGVWVISWLFGNRMARLLRHLPLEALGELTDPPGCGRCQHPAHVVPVFYSETQSCPIGPYKGLADSIMATSKTTNVVANVGALCRTDQLECLHVSS